MPGVVSFYRYLYAVLDLLINSAKVTFTFADRTHSTRGLAYELLPSHCRVDVRKCFFTERVLKPWNSLPTELHHFSSLSVFKSFIFTVDLSEFVTC